MEDHGHYHMVLLIIQKFQLTYYEDWSIHRLSVLTNLSPYHMIRTFKKYTGKTPYEYLTDIRMENAKKMLISESLTITNIAQRCGYNTISYFSDKFKKRIGISPKAFRKANMK
ncbi:MAG: helix-turn-helix transcriptional regulator [Eubacteriales bacterium]